MHDRRRLAVAIALALVLAVALATVVDVSRGPSFHDYAGPRWLLVASNLAFVIAAALARRAPLYLRVAVATIAVGSGAYHAAPSDGLLALDWAPIVVTLSLVLATVLEAGSLPYVVGPVVAVASVAWWVATGGTANGGNMAPYVTAQLGCVLVTPLVAVIARSRVDVRWLLVALVAFALARLAALYDHSLKHVIAAAAAWCALRATYKPIQ